MYEYWIAKDQSLSHQRKSIFNERCFKVRNNKNLILFEIIKYMGEMNATFSANSLISTSIACNRRLISPLARDNSALLEAVCSYLNRHSSTSFFAFFLISSTSLACLTSLNLICSSLRCWACFARFTSSSFERNSFSD